MRYWKVKCGNGYCGCDEEWLMETENDFELGCHDIYDVYSYADGAAGINPISEEDEDFDEENDISAEEYEADIFENMCWEEISEEEFIELRDEEGWEVR